MTTAYKIARIPIDTAKGALELAYWPVHFMKTVGTNVVDTGFKVIGTSTEDKPLESVSGESIYDLANFNLNVASMIYYYTELRSSIKKAAIKLASDNGLSTHGGDSSELIILRNACREVATWSKAIESESPEKTNGTNALKNYQTSIAQLNALAKKFGLDAGDIEAFKTYFEIVSEPKTLIDIKGDLERYDKFIGPSFRLAFGGSEWNRQNIADMIESGHGSYVYEIDDDFAKPATFTQGFLAINSAIKNELLWAIVVCPKKKKVTVVFRGSVNARDWVANVYGPATDCVFPGYTTEKNKNKGVTFGKVHTGFYNYLFGKTKRGENGSSKSKGEEIVGMLKAKFFDKPEFKDYSLEVTGHSLGGAMSTLLSMRLAALNDFPGRTITNVSFASPFVGDEGFRDAFIQLERQRKIRHLRISNYQDMVTLVPPVSLDLPPLPLKHTGMNIRVYEGGDLLAPKYRRFYPKKDSFIDGVRNTLHHSLLVGLSVGIIGKHLCPEYDRRLDDAKDDLSKLSLEELYDNEEVTGWKYLV